jgi:hypothetical protein
VSVVRCNPGVAEDDPKKDWIKYKEIVCTNCGKVLANFYWTPKGDILESLGLQFQPIDVAKNLATVFCPHCGNQDTYVVPVMSPPE